MEPTIELSSENGALVKTTTTPQGPKIETNVQVMLDIAKRINEKYPSERNEALRIKNEAAVTYDTTIAAIEASEAIDRAMWNDGKTVEGVEYPSNYDEDANPIVPPAPEEDGQLPGQEEGTPE